MPSLAATSSIPSGSLSHHERSMSGPYIPASPSFQRPLQASTAAPIGNSPSLTPNIAGVSPQVIRTIAQTPLSAGSGMMVGHSLHSQGSANVYTRSPASFSPSPTVHKQHVKGKRSLVGFDPLLAVDGDTKDSNVPPLPLVRGAKAAPQSVTVTPEGLQTLKPRMRGSTPPKAASDVAVMQPAIGVDSDGSPSSSRNSSPIPMGLESRSPATPLRHSKTGSSLPSQESRKDPSPPRNSPVVKKKDVTALPRFSLTPTKTRSRPWAKGKGHRKTKSLEVERFPNEAIQLDKLSPKPLEVRPGGMDRNSQINSSFVEDLMELRFDTLQLPSLAKPSPTSFLTGTETDALRRGEHEATPFQVEFPDLPELVGAARLIEFVESYRRIDQNFDLQKWIGYSKLELSQVELAAHVPIAQLLLECGDGITLRGLVSQGTSADNRFEVAAFEDQRHIIAVFRGTTELQQKPCNSKHKKKAVPLDSDNPSVEVYQCFFEEYKRIEKDCFALLDKIREEQPFCELIFTGHSFGGAMATLAAFRYANARATARVKCYPMSCPKVGFDSFRLLVNSTPNLRVVRLDYGQDGKTQLPSPAGSHVGHTLVLHGSLGSNSLKTKNPILAYKFEAPKQKKFKTTYPDLRSYVAALEEVVHQKLPWVKDYVGTAGKGVVVNNESRQMV